MTEKVAAELENQGSPPRTNIDLAHIELPKKKTIRALNTETQIGGFEKKKAELLAKI